MLRLLCLLCLYWRWASCLPLRRDRKVTPEPKAARERAVHSSARLEKDFPKTSLLANSPRQRSEPPLEVPSNLDHIGMKDIFENMRYTVVRIQAIVLKVDWLQPYRYSGDSTFIGSGFAVQAGVDSPVFMTNAHVVADARVVQVQLPGVIGQMMFEAYVPLICKKFDLALVQLKDPEKFRQALTSAGGKMHALPIRDAPVNLGLEVAAVGFPLGSSTLKLSEGIISGTEMVDGSMNYQTTAPISPGSSGGPLFGLDKKGSKELKVIGVNFASSASEGAQNVNYVIPRPHILQVLNEFKKLQESQQSTAVVSKSSRTEEATPSTKKSNAVEKTTNKKARPLLSIKAELHSSHNGTRRRSLRGSKLVAAETHEMKSRSKGLLHYQLKIAPIDTIGIESNEATYDTSGGCDKGVFLTRIMRTSVLRSADPPVPDRSFLTAVDSTTLDSFGMGRTENYLGDPTPFESLMQMTTKVDDPVTLTVCQAGKETKHVVSMRWRPEFNLEVREVEEPHFEEHALDFEVFAGVTFMQMTTNHVMELLRSGQPSTLSRWLLTENQEQPHLIITHVEEGTYASRVLIPGMVVSKLNGKNISTLDDMRKKFIPKGVSWTIETDRGLVFNVRFEETLKEQVEESIKSLGKHYLLSSAVLDAAQQQKMLPNGHGKKSFSKSHFFGKEDAEGEQDEEEKLRPMLFTQVEHRGFEKQVVNMMGQGTPTAKHHMSRLLSDSADLV